MQDLLARVREPEYQANPRALAALKKQFQQIKDERDSYYKVREAGIPGNVPVEKIPGKEDLLKGRGRSYYEDQKKSSEVGPLDQKLQRLKVQARRQFPRAHTDDEALALKLLDKETQDDLVSRRTDARQDAELRKNFAQDREQDANIDRLQARSGVQEHGGGIGPRQHWQDLMQERKLSVGDPVVVTAPNEFEGKTGEVAEFSPSGKFVVVNLYNHGDHSMHLSDIAYNEYADQEDDDDWYDEGVAEGKADYNFDAEDLKRLERIRDLSTLKTQALALISRPSAKPMKPEKVEWFKNALDRMNSPIKVIKLMYDLLLSGEGHAVVGSKSSMNPNSYRQRFGEQGVGEAIVASGPSRPLDDRAVRKMVWDTMKINADTGEQAIQRALAVLAKKPQSRMVQDLQDKFQSLADRLAQGVSEAISKKDLLSRLQKDLPKVTDPKNKHAKPVAWTGPGKDDYGYTGYQGHGMPTDKQERELARKNKGVAEEQKPGFGEFPPKQEITIVPPKKLKSGETYQDRNKYWQSQGQAPIYKTNENNDPRAGMAQIYRRLAPKIERYRDSFLAGQLYDELENYAELHGAEREFKQMMNGARNRAHMEYDTNPGGFHNWFWFLPFEDGGVSEMDKSQKPPSRHGDYPLGAKGTTAKPTTPKKVVKSLTKDFEKAFAKEKGVEEGWSDAVVARRTGQPRTPHSVYIKGRKWKDFENDDHAEAVANKLRAKFRAEGRDPSVITVAPTDMSEGVTEDQDTSGVEQAILKRIMVAHLDLLRQYGPEKVMQAAEEVAYNVGDVDEIGTSDVSAYVHQVKQILGATP
jgi:hypothetical protein